MRNPWGFSRGPLRARIMHAHAYARTRDRARTITRDRAHTLTREIVFKASVKIRSETSPKPLPLSLSKFLNCN